MKKILLLIAILSATMAAHAQTVINAPAGWQSQKRDGGVVVFTPPDLQTGEVYSISTYPSVPLEGQLLEDWLRKFGGPVGKTPGQLEKPLGIGATDGRVVTGVGVYVGPNGSTLGALFVGVSLDGGQDVHPLRVLFSGPDVLERYKPAQEALFADVVQRAVGEAGSSLLRVPQTVMAQIKPGGKLVPGVYVGNQYYGAELRNRWRVYLYANGEYRITDYQDGDLLDRWKDVAGTGTYSYKPNSGQLYIDRFMELSNDSDGDEYCYYGRDAQGKAMIVAADRVLNRRTTLVYETQPTKRPAPSTEKARQAAAEAEAKRFKWVVAPGKGVASAQIAALLDDYEMKFDGMSSSVKNEIYLLLKDGTVYAGLPVAPDELDITKSRQKEPEKWGKWTLKNGKRVVSWNGAPYVDLPGDKMLPAPAGTLLSGRYGTARSSGLIGMGSYAFWGVTFGKDGRFSKDRRGGATSGGFGGGGDFSPPVVNSTYDDEGSSVTANGGGVGVAAINKKNNPKGNREGTYSLNGYVLTLRYDSGNVVRLPFFFSSAKRDEIQFDGDRLALDDDK